MNDSMAEVDIVLRIVLCVIVAYKNVDFEAVKINLADADTFGGVPVPVQ